MTHVIVPAMALIATPVLILVNCVTFDLPVRVKSSTEIDPVIAGITGGVYVNTPLL